MRIGIIGLLLAGCSDKNTASTQDTSTPVVTDDTADTTTDDTADTTPDADIFDITAQVSEHVVTVVTVSWKTSAAMSGYIEFGETTDYGRTTPLLASAESQEALLLGLWADTEFHFRVVATDGDGVETIYPDQTITTGTLPPELAALAVEGEATWEGYITLPIHHSRDVVAILDNQGRYVWYSVISVPGHGIMRAVQSADGQWVAVCLAGREQDGKLEDGYILKISMDGSTTETIPAPFIDHDMTMKPDGTYVGIVLDYIDGYFAPADKIIEYDEAGGSTEIFNAWDHQDKLIESVTPQTPRNWTHANAIDYDEEQDVYYLGMKDLHSTAKIDAATGEILWVMGGWGNQFTYPEGTDALTVHHQLQVVGDRVLHFENGDNSRGYSRVLEYEIDEETLTATQVWEYSHEPPVFTPTKGDVHRLDNGNTLINWTSASELQEVTEAKEVLWTVSAPVGTQFNFWVMEDGLYGE